jgi:Rrf2 family protein
MILTQKTQYAIRAILELARQKNKGPIKIADIARAQYIPIRFLEVILNQLKGSGFVESKRGYHGGYTLVRSPEKITIGDVFRFIQKPQSSRFCLGCETKNTCPFRGECMFLPVWEKIRNSIYDIYDQTTIQDLIPKKKKMS